MATDEKPKETKAVTPVKDSSLLTCLREWKRSGVTAMPQNDDLAARWKSWCKKHEQDKHNPNTFMWTGTAGWAMVCKGTVAWIGTSPADCLAELS